MIKKTFFVPVEQIKLSGRFEFTSLCDGIGGFSIVVSDYDGKSYSLHWDVGVVAYQNTDEGDRLRLVSDLSSGGLIGYLVLECINSKYINWISEEKYGIKLNNLRHFVVITSNDILDVLDYDLPLLSKIGS